MIPTSSSRTSRTSRTWQARPGVFVALRPFGEDSENVDPALLFESEQRRLAEITSERRRREWFAGRLAAHDALAAAGASPLAVLREPRGAPVLAPPTNAGADPQAEAHAHDFRIAISHGRRLAGAVAGPAHLGCPHLGLDIIDPEDIDRLARLAKRVFSPLEFELALTLTENPQDVFRVAWGAREAIAKATRTGMFAFALTHVRLSGLSEDDAKVENIPGGAKVFHMRTPDDEVIVIAQVSNEAFAWAQSVMARTAR